jgi:glucose-6-phosphate 1-dehydrogenase
VSDAESCLFIVFGGTGDLMERKLLPALEKLAPGRKLAVLGVGRRQQSDEKYRDWIVSTAGDRLPRESFRYHSIGDKDFDALARCIEEVEQAHGLPGNRVFYLALPPGAFPATIEGLGEAGLNSSDGWTRVVVEKPFGEDLASAEKLNELTHRWFDESQIYRIDHYLGKETVQNLLVFRFANTIFESIWNRDRVASVQITASETIGVEDRAGYYDRAGALRDMVQNHVTQLLALVGMEPPVAFDAEQVRREKVKLLRAVRPIGPGDVVFGQYAGYRDEPGVGADSATETYVAVRLFLDNWRWQGVPFYLRSGKRLARRVTEIAVTFHDAPVCLFESMGDCKANADVLVLTLQPDEGFTLCLDVKVPGEPFRMRPLPLEFSYRDAFGAVPDAYDTLLHDVLIGDQTLFVHADEAEASWRLYTPLLENRPELHAYESGAWGPDAADEMLAELAHEWHDAAQAT